MKFLEKDLEDLIYDNQTIIETKGLKVNWWYSANRKMLRQVRIGGYGVADLINIEYYRIANDPTKKGYANRMILVTVIECKLNKIDLNAYAQAKRYVTGIREAMKKHDLRKTEIRYRIMLIGSQICTDGDFVFVHNNDKDCEAYTYSYGIHGLKFKEVSKSWIKGERDTQADFTNQGKNLIRDFNMAYFQDKAPF